MKSQRFQHIEQLPGFVKDTSSGAILNTDTSALEAYKIRKKMMNQINTDQERIERLEDKIDRLEALLTKVLENK